MDEIELKANCGRHSFYISLQDQKEAITSLKRNLQPPRHAVSKDHTTHVHLVTQHEQHWAAVQISIQPFPIPTFPGQKFHSCHFRYSPCCQTPAQTRPTLDHISNAVQRIYDVFYQPTQWDFSVRQWYV